MKTFRTVNNFSDVSGYKINLEKSIIVYTPPTNIQRKKSWSYKSPKENQVSRNKLTQESEGFLQ